MAGLLHCTTIYSKEGNCVGPRFSCHMSHSSDQCCLGLLNQQWRSYSQDCVSPLKIANLSIVEAILTLTCLDDTFIIDYSEDIGYQGILGTTV